MNFRSRISKVLAAILLAAGFTAAASDEALFRVPKAGPRLEGADASRVRNTLIAARDGIQWPTKAQAEPIGTRERHLRDVPKEIDAGLAAMPPAVKARCRLRSAAGRKRR